MSNVLAIRIWLQKQSCVCILAVLMTASFTPTAGVLPLDGKAASDGFEAEGGWCVQGAVAPEARESRCG